MTNVASTAATKLTLRSNAKQPCDDSALRLLADTAPDFAAACMLIMIGDDDGGIAHTDAQADVTELSAASATSWAVARPAHRQTTQQAVPQAHSQSATMAAGRLARKRRCLLAMPRRQRQLRHSPRAGTTTARVGPPCHRPMPAAQPMYIAAMPVAREQEPTLAGRPMVYKRHQNVHARLARLLQLPVARRQAVGNAKARRALMQAPGTQALATRSAIASHLQHTIQVELQIAGVSVASAQGSAHKLWTGCWWLLAIDQVERDL
jgi:hypothetical protein